MRLTYDGDGPYTGWDGDHLVAADPGDTIEVSEGKAEQLLSDFPDTWAREGERVGPDIKTLRAEAKSWELSAGGSKDEIAERIDEHVAKVRAELAERSLGELQALAAGHDVHAESDDPGVWVSALINAHVAWHAREGE